MAPLEKPLEVLLARLALLLRARADPLAQRLELLLLPVQQLALRAQGLLLPLLLGPGQGCGVGLGGRVGPVLTPLPRTPPIPVRVRVRVR